MSKGFLGKITGGNNSRGSAGTTSVAVLGTGRGVGATHYSIMLASYLANVCGYGVGLVELNRQGILGGLAGSLPERLTRQIRIYGQQGVDVPWIMAQGHDYVVLDISADMPCGAGEFARSDIRFVVCGLVPWKLGEAMSMMERLEGSRVTYLSLPRDRACLRKISDRFGLGVEQIPYTEDVSCLEPSTCAWLGRMMEVGRNPKTWKAFWHASGT